MNKRLNLSLKVLTQFSIFDETVYFKLLYSNIGEFILSFEDVGGCTFSNFSQLGKVGKTYFL